MPAGDNVKRKEKIPSILKGERDRRPLRGHGSRTRKRAYLPSGPFGLINMTSTRSTAAPPNQSIAPDILPCLELFSCKETESFLVLIYSLVDNFLRKVVTAVRVCLEPVPYELLVVRRL